MMGWEIGDRNFQRKQDDLTGWTTDDLSLGFHLNWTFRGSFSVVHGWPEPVETGNLYVQWKSAAYTGGQWEDWESYYGKDIEPGWTEDPTGEWPVDHPAEWVEWAIQFQGFPVGTIIDMRLRVEALGGNYYSDPIRTTITQLSGELDDWFEEDHRGIHLHLHSRLTLLGEYREPSRLELKVLGTQPFIICEHSLVDDLVIGDSIKVCAQDAGPDQDTEFILKSRRPQRDGTAKLLLSKV